MNFTFNAHNGKPIKTLSLLALSTVLLAQVPGSWMMATAQEEGETIAQSSFWDFNPQTNQLRLTLSPGVAPRYFLLARPMRIAIEFPNTVEVSPQTLQYGGAVEELMVSPQSNGNLRITLQLRSGVELEPKQVALQQIDSQRWLITPLIANPSGATDSSTPIAPANLSIPPANLPARSSSLPSPISQPILEDRSSAAALSPSPLTRPPDLAPVSPAPSQWPTQIVELFPQDPSSEAPAANPADLKPQTLATPSFAVATPAQTDLNSTTQTPGAVTFPTQPVVSTAIEDSAAEQSALQTLSLPTTPIASGGSSSALPSSSIPSAVDDRNPVPPAQPVVQLEFGQVLPIAGSQITPISQRSTPIANTPTPNSSPANPSTANPSTANTRNSDPRNSDNPDVIRPLTAITVAGIPRPTLDQVVPAPITTTAPITTAPTIALTPTAPTVPVPTQSQHSTPTNPNPTSPIPSNPNILLAKGSPIPLRYTGTVPLRVPAGAERQEVLLVDEDIKSAQGQVIIPGGSQVVGRFETNWRGSRFVAQAISLGRYNQSFGAKSERLESDRSPNPVGIGAGSGSGAIAGTLFGGAFGALGGAAIGAVSGYFMSPQPMTLEPHQVLIVYLAEDWLAN